ESAPEGPEPLGTVTSMEDYRSGRGGGDDDGGAGGSGGGGDIPPRRKRFVDGERYAATDDGLYQIKFDAKKNEDVWHPVFPVRVHVVGKYAQDLGDGEDVVTTHYDLAATYRGKEHVLRNVDV